MRGLRAPGAWQRQAEQPRPRPPRVHRTVAPARLALGLSHTEEAGVSPGTCMLPVSQPSPTAGGLLLSGLFSTSFSQDGHPGHLSSAPAYSEAGGCWRPIPNCPPTKCRKAMGSLWTLCPGSALYRQLPTHKEASGNQPGQIWVPEKSPTSTYAHTTPDGTQGGLVSKSPHPAQAGPAAGGHPDALPGGGPGPGTSLHMEQSWALASPRHPLGHHAPASLGHRGRCGAPICGLFHSCD